MKNWLFLSCYWSTGEGEDLLLFEYLHLLWSEVWVECRVATSVLSLASIEDVTWLLSRPPQVPILEILVLLCLTTRPSPSTPSPPPPEKPRTRRLFWKSGLLSSSAAGDGLISPVLWYLIWRINTPQKSVMKTWSYSYHEVLIKWEMRRELY